MNRLKQYSQPWNATVITWRWEFKENSWNAKNFRYNRERKKKLKDEMNKEKKRKWVFKKDF